MDFTAETATDAVLASFAATPDPRTRHVLEALTRHLHAFVREVQPSMAEWAAGVDFLTALGQASDEHRQEVILASDVLGVSMLVEALNTAADVDGVTASTVLGPFHVVESPRRELGDSIDLVGTGTPCVVHLRVQSPSGEPVAGASVDVWQCDENGFYDVLAPETQPPGNGRGLFTADAAGSVHFRTVVPSHYPIPTDGPVGELLRAGGRHPYRPAHVHLIVDAAGFVPLTTHVFVADSPYIDSDAVFAATSSLVRDFVPGPDGIVTAEVDLVLQPRG